MDPNAILNRLVRLLKFDTSVFDEVRDDAKELVPAMIVAAAAALIAGLGTTLHFVFLWNEFLRPENPWLNMFILGGVFTAALYGVWVLIAYVVLVQVSKATVDLQSMLRTMGYAAWPLALVLFMFIPVLWPVFAIGALVLLFVMSIYAVQSVTNAESTQVVIANLAGAAVFILVLSIIAFSSDSTRYATGVFAVLFEPIG
ncbi:MAG TPA: hypothetical protein PKD27_10870 [Tepidiformaceae bacterium]|mgnify:CR=1 FL=1|nr:hypothetical protein [Tepidiformaceae bacterium]